MEKVWLKEYPAGIPEDIDITAYQSVVDIFEQSIAKFGPLAAYENLGHTITYSELDRLTRDFAAYLQQVLKLEKGDRVAVMMPNLLQYPVAVFGILRAGLTVVNVNPLYTARELEHQLNDAGARAIIIVENFCTTLQAILGQTRIEHVITTQIADLLPQPKRSLVNFAVKRVKKMVPAWHIPGTTDFRAALKKGRSKTLSPVSLTRDNVAFLQYTGGTTGVSKGATLLHGNIIANVLQARIWLGDRVEEGKEIIITALPLYHIFALTANCLVYLATGGKNVLITNPRDMPGFVKELGKHRFSALTGVNTLFNGLLNTPGFAELDFSALKLTLGGGTAVQESVAKQWTRVTGKPLTEAYGLSETSPAVTINPMTKPDYNGTIGVPLPSTVVSLRGDDDQEVPVGQPGELCVQGPQVMRGYWNRPEENEKSFTSDGFFRTGDIAVMDEKGYFKIVDRKKDMILVSGFNVFPNEIEGVVAAHPGVLECACIGVPDEKSGEAAKVFVVKKDPDLTVESLKAHCKENLTGYKVPRYFEFREDLPKSNVGKILRKELRS